MEYKKTFMSVKEMPVSERPYEKCERHGASSLSDSELIAVLLRSGKRGERVTELAQRVLLSLKPRERLSALDSCSLYELMEIDGIGRVKAIQLKCAAELGRRIMADKGKEALSLFDAESVAEYYRPKLAHLDKEKVLLLYADGKGRIFGEDCISVGTVNSAPLSARVVFISAIEHKAVGIFLIHNHPSGDPEPSHEDYMVTERIQQAGRLMGIQLIDHIIVGSAGYVSFCELGLLSRQ